MSQKSISIDTLLNRFDLHIELEENKNIFFSGEFGVGKSYFLHRYFDEERNDLYNAIYLHPVNYVVSSNEDIFQLIKAEILGILFGENWLEYSEGVKFNKSDYLSHYIFNNPIDFSRQLVKMFSKLSVETTIVNQFVESAFEINKVVEKYKDIIDKAGKSKVQNAAQFYTTIIDKTDGFLSQNEITNVIKDTLMHLKKETEKKNVLIIDDLDRLDPEHIFRILNILSAHNNYNSTENKFGFDHVVLVGDIENIHKIYKHRYGDNVDFEGYIDKFYNREIFVYSNKDAINEYILKHIDIKLSDNAKLILAELLAFFASHKKITTRQIIKYRHTDSKEIKSYMLREIDILKFENGCKKDLHSGHYCWQIINSFVNSSHIYFDTGDFEILKVISVLKNIFGSYSKLHDTIKSLLKANSSDFISVNYNSIGLIYVLLKFRGEQNFSSDTTLLVENLQNPTGYPIFNMNGNDHFVFNLNWNRANPYKGDVGFYKNIQSVFVNKSGIPDISRVPVSEMLNKLNEACHLISSNLQLRLTLNLS